MTNPDVQAGLTALKLEMTDALSKCCHRMMDACDTMAESVDAMDKIVDIVSEHQQMAICLLIGSCLDLEKHEGQVIVPHSALRQYVNDYVQTFGKDLIANISQNLRNVGHPDIMSPNQALVDDILEGIDVSED